MWQPPDKLCGDRQVNYVAAARHISGGRQKNMWQPPDNEWRPSHNYLADAR